MMDEDVPRDVANRGKEIIKGIENLRNIEMNSSAIKEHLRALLKSFFSGNRRIKIKS